MGKNILIYGGSFNPITKGHLLVAAHVLKEVRDQYDEIWFMPDYKSLYDKKLVSGRHRLNMIACTIQDYKDELGKDYLKIRPYDYLIKHKFVAGTLCIMKHLLEGPLAYIDNVGLLIGMDQANIIHTWLGEEELTEKYPFVVVTRPAVLPTEHSWYKNRPHKLVESPLSHDISSTIVRDAIKKQGITSLVSPSTMKYIKEHNLYV